MAKNLGILFAFILLICVGGCGGGSSASPTPTPTPSQIFPNDTALAQPAPVKLGTSGGNANDLGNKFCCIGTLGSLWTRADIVNPVILSNNHVLDKSEKGVVGDPIIQPLQSACLAPTAPAPLTVAHLTQAAKLKPTANETSSTSPCAGDNTKAALCGNAPDNVDAAIAEVVPGQVDSSGTILDLGPVGPSSIAAAQPSSTVAVAALGETVGKAGRTTGLTCSTIQSLAATILINYEGTCGDEQSVPPVPPAFTAYFTNQVIIAGGSFSAGGDSGSLIVDTSTSRPVALLYGGNSTGTSANPIQDVIAKLSAPAAPLAVVGGADHSISCARTATASNTQVSTAQSALVPQEQQRVAAIQKARAQSLIRDFGVASVAIGPSADNPKEGALVLHVSGKSAPAVPPVIDGVRTRLVFDDANVAAQLPTISTQQVQHAIAVKEAHVGEWMSKPGIQGVGVTISADNPTEAAISIYLVKGGTLQPIPPIIDGVRTRTFEGDRFRAY